MFSGIKNGWQLIKSSVKIFERYPKFIAPLLGSWVFYAPVVLYLEFGVNYDAYTNGQLLLLSLAVIFFFALLLTFSSSVLLELIEQHESGEQLSLSTAFGQTLKRNSYKLLPIIIIWTVIWFLLTLIEALLSEKDGSNNADKEFNAKNVATTLAGSGDASFMSLSFDALRKGVRMIVFLVLPAVTWENKGSWQAIKRGLAILKNNPAAFATGYVMTGLISTLVFLPVGLLAFGSAEMGVDVSQLVWFMAIVYTAFAWSYSMYLEQMFAAELFLWYKSWEETAIIAREQNEEVPKMQDISRPSLLDKHNDLGSTPPPPEPPENN